jgi:hypothetical protein
MTAAGQVLLAAGEQLLSFFMHHKWATGCALSVLSHLQTHPRLKVARSALGDEQPADIIAQWVDVMIQLEREASGSRQARDRLPSSLTVA